MLIKLSRTVFVGHTKWSTVLRTGECYENEIHFNGTSPISYLVWF